MSDPAEHLERFSESLHGTALQIRDILANQQQFQQNIADMRDGVRQIRNLLSEGPAPLMVRVMLLEQQMQTIKESQTRGRDWWLKVLASVATAGALAILGALLAIYASKNPVLKLP